MLSNKYYLCKNEGNLSMNYSKIQLGAMMKLAKFTMVEASVGYIEHSLLYETVEFKTLISYLAFLTNSRSGVLLADKESRNISLQEATIIVCAMSMTQKRYFCGLVGAILLADGYVTNKELEFWNDLSYQLDLPMMSIEEAGKIYQDFLKGFRENKFEHLML